ncbi:MAG: helix-turn-helix domain-containing protein [Oscillospiraceae bacterium]|nr:helix-turn-helix domain-containing protein [Oscillospiraceae bacterium]
MASLPQRIRGKPFAIAYASYALLLGVILLIWALSFSRMMVIAEQDALASMRGALSQGEIALNDSLTSIDHLVTRTMSYPLVRSAMRMDAPLKDADYNLLRRLNDEYSWAMAQEPYLARFFIYFHSSESFAGDFGVSARSRIVYDNYINYAGISYEQWRGLVASSGAFLTAWPAANVKLGSALDRCVTFLYSVQEYGLMTRRATIAALISESTLRDCFHSAEGVGASEFLLVDDGGAVLYESAAVQGGAVGREAVDAFIASGRSVEYIDHDGKQFIMLRGERTAHGLVTMAVIDYSIIRAKLAPLNKLFAVVFTTAFIVGVALVILLSRLNNQPLRRIEKLLQAMPHDIAETPDAPRLLDTKINNIISVNSSLAARLDASSAMLEDMFQERLFLTGFDNEQELRRLADLSGFVQRGGAFMVAAFLLDAYERSQLNAQEIDERERLRFIALDHALKSLPSPPSFVRAVGENRAAALFPIGEAVDPNAFISAALGELFPILIGGARITGHVGVSAPFERLIDARNAYIEADVALASIGSEECGRQTTAGTSGGCIAFYTELPVTSFALYYPLEKETQLMRLIRSGDADGATELLSQIYKRNYVDSPISEQMHRQLAHDLRSTFLRLIADIAAFTAWDMKDLYKNILDLHVHSDAERQRRLFNSTITTLCETVVGTRKDSRSGYAQNVTKYIAEHCCDPELTLQSTADAFHLSQAYLSRCIREATGRTFSALVEEGQMDMARDLISGTQTPIADVAARCGYSSVNTFFKAFKRVFGMSPSAMRHSNQA